MDASRAGHQDWLGRAATLKPPTRLIIGGRLVPARTGATSPVRSPRDGACLAEVGDGEPADDAVAAARRAFEDSNWSRLTPAQRKAVLHRLADAVEANRDELALLISLEMGKPISTSRAIEMRTTISCYRWYAEWADKLSGETPDVGSEALALVTREPAGVVGAVVPWNFPMTLAAWKIAPALAAGCTVVIKPSELSPLSMLRLAELALEAGLPDGVLNVVTGGPDAGRALGLHPGVDVLAFTGSTAVGRQYLRYAADSNLKRVWLELGGKSPALVLPDADVQAAAAAVAATSSSTRARCAPPRHGWSPTGPCTTNSWMPSHRSRMSCGSGSRSTRPPRWARWSAPPTAAGSKGTSGRPRPKARAS